MRRTPLLLLIVVAVAGCGGSSKHAGTTGSTNLKPPAFDQAQARTVSERTAQFTQLTSVTINGQKVIAYTNGTISFADRAAHLYKIVPGNNVPTEEIVAGPIVYSNQNVQAALQDPTVPAWTKLDTDKLTAKERASHPDDLAYVLAPAYLSSGVQKPTFLTSTPTRALFTGTVREARLSLPDSQKDALLTTIHSDYPAGSFKARFSLDGQGRVRRVLVHYTTSKGTPITIDTRYIAFGVKVDVRPPQTTVKDITPR